MGDEDNCAKKYNSICCFLLLRSNNESGSIAKPTQSAGFLQNAWIRAAIDAVMQPHKGSSCLWLHVLFSPARGEYYASIFSATWTSNNRRACCVIACLFKCSSLVLVPIYAIHHHALDIDIHHAEERNNCRSCCALLPEGCRV